MHGTSRQGVTRAARRPPVVSLTHLATPHRIPPHPAAPHRTPPHPVAPRRSTPHPAAPYRIPPHLTAPRRTVPRPAVPRRITSYRDAPRSAQLHHATSRHTSPHPDASQRTPPRLRTSPHPVASDLPPPRTPLPSVSLHPVAPSRASAVNAHRTAALPHCAAPRCAPSHPVAPRPTALHPAASHPTATHPAAPSRTTRRLATPLRIPTLRNARRCAFVQPPHPATAVALRRTTPKHLTAPRPVAPRLPLPRTHHTRDVSLNPHAPSRSRRDLTLSHRMASHPVAPCRTTPHHAPSCRTAPHPAAPHRIPPHPNARTLAESPPALRDEEPQTLPSTDSHCSPRRAVLPAKTVRMR